jgi:heat shock protein HslJ
MNTQCPLWTGARTTGAAGLALLGLLLAGCAKEASAPAAVSEATAPATSTTPTREQMLNARVAMGDETVQLSNGRWEGEPAAGGASRPSLQLWEPTILLRNVDGQPGEEGMALLSFNGGGSGEFVWVGAFRNVDGQPVGTLTQIGDRVRLYRAWVEHDQLHLDMIEAGPNDPACCPTQLMRKAYAWKDGRLELASNDKVGNASLNLLASTDWMLVEMDGKPLPAGVTPPTALVEYGAIKGYAGCNRYSGKIAEPQAGALKIDAVSAQGDKACDAAAMQLQADFLQRLAASESYGFQAGRLLLAGKGAGRDGPSLLFSR